MTLRVPKRSAEKPNAKRLFPAGEWLLEIDEVRSRAPQPWMYDAKPTEKNPNPLPRVVRGGEILGIQLGSAVALAEGQEDPGNQKIFLDLIVSDGDTSIDNVDLDAKDAGVGWGILKDTRMYANLALALGQTFEDEGFVITSDDFLERLRNGEFNGHKVIATVTHTPYRNGNGINVAIEAFAPAA